MTPLELHDKEVRFDIFCKRCKHQYEAEGDDPCNDCLSRPYRLGTKKPIRYEEGDRSFRRKNKAYNRKK